MKIRILFITITLLCFLGCNNSNTNETGTIKINLPTAGSRSWVNSDVSSSASSYELFIYNSTTFIETGRFLTSDLNDDRSYTITLDVGTYDVVAIAGDSSYVIGFGESEDVAVVGDQYTDVNIELNTYSWTTTWPSSTLYTDSSFTINVEATMPISCISLPTASLITSNTESGGKYDFRLDATDYYFSFTKSPDNPGTYNATVELTTPIAAGDYSITSGCPYSSLFLVDDKYSVKKAITRWAMAEDHSDLTDGMRAQFKYDLSVVADTTSEGMKVTFTWGED